MDSPTKPQMETLADCLYGTPPFYCWIFSAGITSTAAAMFLDALRWETRAEYLDHVQRNTMVVAIAEFYIIRRYSQLLTMPCLASLITSGGSLGAGATPWQTTVRIILPTAASGLFSAVMIGFGRAIGETMIVLMAAGNTPLMDWNVFSGFQTLSATIATELPETTQGSAHYRILFLAAVLLFGRHFLLTRSLS